MTYIAYRGSSATWNLGKVRVYIMLPTGRVGRAELTPSGTSTGAHAFLVYHYDNLGSITAVTPWGETSTATATLFANDVSGKESLYNYDPWGQRRDAGDWIGASSTSSTYTWGWDSAVTSADEDDLISRGFTGHEMLDGPGVYQQRLIHMNGRIYDAKLGRFLSADPIIQNPYDLQSYNRYSYCLNNPLRYTDPTGYETDAEKKKRLEEENEKRRKEDINRYALGGSVYDMICGSRSSGGDGSTASGASQQGTQAAGTLVEGASDTATQTTQNENTVDNAQVTAQDESTVETQSGDDKDSKTQGDSKLASSEGDQKYVVSANITRIGMTPGMVTVFRVTACIGGCAYDALTGTPAVVQTAELVLLENPVKGISAMTDPKKITLVDLYVSIDRYKHSGGE